ncbi:hypothetical protein GCM10010495_48750 [Kitasatospora herbaricolor]|uniref:hypothetical protein n=1 Tax=Kitasatospora herbaricolor TaxID=68217 RepID=UPI001748A2F9|nr:hypothetical protein [Kitasatospora herbaricolor]MDQ0305758.1 hypothetical protein [Kitasatospora herbaricolor]GGV26966.1 hypothetical protein GCM10010495_48750 [Kitasatospora herbaricolor]
MDYSTLTVSSGSHELLTNRPPNGPPAALAPLLRAVAPGVDLRRVAAGAEHCRTRPSVLRPYPGQGTLGRRLVMIEHLDGRWAVADLSGPVHESRHWPQSPSTTDRTTSSSTPRTQPGEPSR